MSRVFDFETELVTNAGFATVADDTKDRNCGDCKQQSTDLLSYFLL
jgi:hypothetical protein